MARNPTKRSSKPFTASSDPKPSSSSSNKSKSKRKLDPTTAYTYLPSLPKRHRTSEAQNSLSRDEASQAPRPSNHSRRGDGEEGEEDSEEDMRDRIRKVAMRIAGDEAGLVDSESEESSVDSDNAWSGEDEERWGDVFRDLDKGKGKEKENGRGKGKGKGKEVVRKAAKPLTVNLDEEEEEEATIVKPKAAGKGKASVRFDDEDEDEEEEEDLGGAGGDPAEDEIDGLGDDEERSEEEEEDDVDDSEPELPSDEEDEDEPDFLDGLDAFVESLASGDKKRLADDEETLPEKKKKRRVLPVILGPSIGSNDLALRSNQKIDLSALIASHPSLSSSTAALLQPKSKSTSTTGLSGGTLPAPLPTVVQERLDREAAYEKTKEEGQKWSGVMKRIKEAEHLSFPLQANERGGVKSNGEMLAGFKPSNAHESAVQALLDQANLTDKAMTQHEDDALQAQELSLEEITKRRDQLRLQRELMFRAETRSKRVAKIKSKTFRKLARKRAEKAGGGEVDALDPEEAEEEREKMERARATERATLRHGARNRWAKDVGGDGGEIEERRLAKADMLELKERLTRKIHGDDGEDSPSESSENEGDGEDGIKSSAFDQIARLDEKEINGENGKGLMSMAFMKKAREREVRKAKEDEADLRKDIEMFGEEGSEEGVEEDEEVEVPTVMKVGEGRMVFSGPTPGTPPLANGTTSISKPPQRPLPTTAIQRPSQPSPESPANPWLVASTTSGPSRKKNTATNTAESRATNALKKAAQGRDKGLDDTDEVVEITIDGSNMRRKQIRGDSDEEGDDEDELLPVNASGVKAFKQRDLVAEAFAGDNVVEDFAQAKAKQVEEDAPKVENLTLPGWGSWGGKGAPKRRNKINPKFLKTHPGIEPSSRKDANKTNVIISEKSDKKAKMLLPKDLPYPFTSVMQYEKSLEMPVGKEWNSGMGVQRGIMPRVVKKRGAIMEPVRRLF